MDQYAHLNDRNVDGPREGFGSLLPTHSRLNEKRFFQTENRDNFGGPPSSSSLLKNAAKMRFAGSTSRPFDEQKVRQISNLMGENFDEQHDAQERIYVQRQWLPQTDVAIQNINSNKARLSQTNMFDNSNSLPIGEGTQLAFR